MRLQQNTVSIFLGLFLLSGVMFTAHAERNESETKSTSTSTTTTITPGVTIPIPSTPPNCMTRALDSAGEGRRAYLRLNCYSCHGMDGKGGMGPNIVGEGGEVSEVVLRGEGGGMPSYKGYLCTNDLADLKAYLNIMGKASAPTFNDWWVPKPLK